MTDDYSRLGDVERLALCQALYNAIGSEVKTGDPDNLRGRVNAEYLDLYERTGATGFEVRILGEKVGTYGFDKVKGTPAHVERRLEVTNPDAMLAGDDPDFAAFLDAWVLRNAGRVARDYLDETGAVPPGAELAEVEVPATPDGIRPGGRLRVRPDRVADALRNRELPDVAIGLLGGE